MTEQADLTDPATEIFELAQLLGCHQGNPSNIRQHDALANLFGSEVGGAQFFTILATIRNRLNDFEILVKESRDIRPKVRDNGLKALASIAGVIDVRHSHETWESVRGRYITEAHLNSITGLEQYFATAHPMKRLDNAERKALLTEMDNLLADLKAGNAGFDPLLIDAISNAFSDLRLVLEKFQFFGRRVAEERLVMVASAVQCLQRQGGAHPSAEQRTFYERSREILTRIAAVVIAVGGLEAGSETIYHGLGWVATHAIEQIAAPLLIPDLRSTDGSGNGKPTAPATDPAPEPTDT